jgi:protocatechuate 3,4-dioxygenase beta subunit
MNRPPVHRLICGRVAWALVVSLLAPLLVATTILAPRFSLTQRIGACGPSRQPEAAGPAPLAPAPAVEGLQRQPLDSAQAAAVALEPGPAFGGASARTGPGVAELALLLVDGASGAPVPRGEIELVSAAGTALHRADADGVLALELAPGTWSAVAWSDALTGGPLELELKGGALASAELVLTQGAAVEGRIVDARSGAPLPGARVSFWTHSEADAVVTGADGRFHHPRFPAHDPSQQVRIEAAGYAPAVRYLELLEDGGWAHRAAHTGERDVIGQAGPAFVEVALSPALVLAGRVLDPAGRPLAGALVAARGYARVLPEVAARDDAMAETDALGRFTLGGLRGDVSHALVVRAEGCAELVRELPAQDALEPAELGDLELTRGALLAGSIADAAGAPVAGARVELRLLDLAPPALSTPADPGARPDVGRRTLRTDAAGRFFFDELAAGRYELRVRRDRGVLATLELDLGAAEERDDARLALPPSTWTLDGLVRGPSDPLPGATVVLERFGAVAELATDANGAFRVAGLDDVATYTLRASASGYATAETRVSVGMEPVLRLAPVLAAAQGSAPHEPGAQR